MGYATPSAPSMSKKIPLVGLVIGLVLGGALAYLRASRRRSFADRAEPAVIYDAPLIGEIPAFDSEE